MKVILLAAGSGARMKPLTDGIPKALLKLGGESLLTRFRRQFASNGVDEVIVVAGYGEEKVRRDIEENVIAGLKTTIVFNSNYANDTNIVSLQLALDNINEGYYIFEADIIFEDDCMSYILSTEWGENSVWYTSSHFNDKQYGGILRTDENGKVNDIKIVKEYDEQYKNYKKLIGVTKVGIHEASIFKRYIDQYITEQRDCYYLAAWYENIEQLASLEGDISKFAVFSFNRKKEFEDAVDYFMSNLTEFTVTVDNNKVSLVEVSKLRQIEGFDENRVEWLFDKIKNEGRWSDPLKIENNNHLVLDGQHRMQVAIRMGLTHVPCIKYVYEEVEIWSLREDEFVSRERVINRVLKGDLYPFKTVKHKFKNLVKCNFSLTDLGYKGERV